MSGGRPLDCNALAARYVARCGPGSPAQRRELLDMLGLLAGDGRSVLPQPRPRATNLGLDDLAGPATAYGRNGFVDHAIAADTKERPRVSSAPPGLRDYVPTGPEPGVARRKRLEPGSEVA